MHINWHFICFVLVNAFVLILQIFFIYCLCQDTFFLNPKYKVEGSLIRLVGKQYQQILSLFSDSHSPQITSLTLQICRQRKQKALLQNNYRDPPKTIPRLSHSLLYPRVSSSPEISNFFPNATSFHLLCSIHLGKPSCFLENSFLVCFHIAILFLTKHLFVYNELVIA